MNEKKIYLDNAATTPLDKQVVEKMKKMMEFFGNPSSIYQDGRVAKKLVDQSRQKVADILNCKDSEIIFTGSGTESDNLAILGAARANKEKGKHIITTKIEHHAVLHPMQELEKEGFEITYLNVNSNGIIDVDDLKQSLRKDTILVSIMYANNEIGTIQPIKEIAKILKAQGKKQGFLPVFHTDACQAINYLDVNVKNLGVDLMSFSGSKIYGPKGIGVLYKSEDIKLEPIVFGGGQEMGYRSGTESLMMISGVATALKKTENIKQKEVKRLKILKNYFLTKISKQIKGIKLNGDEEKRLPNNLNFSIKSVEGEALVLMLDSFGIEVSTGSACSSDSLDLSHVIETLKLPQEYAHGSLRLTLGRDTTKKDLDYVIDKLDYSIKHLRKFSAV